MTTFALLSLVVNFDFLPLPLKSFGKLKYLIFEAGGIYDFKV